MTSQPGSQVTVAIDAYLDFLRVERGLSPATIGAYATDLNAFARFTGATSILVGRDMRPSGLELSGAFIDGVVDQGIDVIDLGLIPTDLLYFAAGKLDMPGATFTGSHNPAAYNGIKVRISRDRLPQLRVTV